MSLIIKAIFILIFFFLISGMNFKRADNEAGAFMDKINLSKMKKISYFASDERIKRELTDAINDSEEAVRVAIGKIDGSFGDTLGPFLRSVLLKKKGYKVLERERMEEILKEWSFQTSTLADEESSIALGRILASNYVIFGNAEKINYILFSSFIIDLKMVNVETGEIGWTLKRDFSVTTILGVVSLILTPIIFLLSIIKYLKRKLIDKELASDLLKEACDLTKRGLIYEAEKKAESAYNINKSDKGVRKGYIDISTKAKEFTLKEAKKNYQERFSDGDFTKLIPDLLLITESEPFNSEALYMLMVSYYRTKDYHRTIECGRKLMLKNYRFDETRIMLGDSFCMVGNIKDAFTLWDNMLNTLDDAVIKRDVKKRLGHLLNAII